MKTGALWKRPVWIQFFPKCTHLGEIFWNILSSLLEIIDGRTKSGNPDSIIFGKSLFQIFPNLWNVIMKNNSLSYGFRNWIDNPWMYQMIAPFPCCSVQILNIRLWKSAIDERKFVLRSQSTLHWATPSQVIGAIELRDDRNRIWTFARMNVENWFNIWLIWCSLDDDRCLTRRHDANWRNREKLRRKKRRNQREERREKDEEKVTDWSNDRTKKLREKLQQATMVKKRRKTEVEDEDWSGSNRNRKRLGS
jgi:hypothetical protein